MDYTDLNEACLMESFLLPQIDQIVDVTAEHGILSFLDTFSRYHQILMHPPYAKKTTFIMLHGLYYYDVMPFGLKNARVTYQRLVSKIFRSLLGNTMEAYIDNMVVKSKEHFNHTKHLQEAFELLQRYDLKLNPLKCAFGVSLGKCLGFMVTQRGIEANPIQLKAIMDSQTPTSRKGVQQLTSRLTALGRFISRLTNRLKPFFIILRGSKKTGWNEECDQAFTAIKQYLIELSILAKPRAGNTLYLYLAVSKALVSADLFKEDENRKHRPIFFVRKSLSKVETRYTCLE